MRKTLLLLAFSLVALTAFGQDKEKAHALVDEGIAYYKKGDYEGAITRYDKALQADENNLFALAEKSMTYLAMERYDDAVKFAEMTIDKHPGDDDLVTVYVTLGNAHDALKQTDKSIAVYEEGLKLFPDYYGLHFNKGITLLSVQKYDEALQSFETAVSKNPQHASSHNAIARLRNYKGQSIASLLAYCRFLVIEPLSQRSQENFKSMQEIMKGSAEKTGKKSITVNISPNMLSDTTEDGKPKENNFGSTYLILAMSSALDYDKSNKKKTEVELFQSKFESVCESLKASKKDNFGFYWDFYAPYFIDMKEQGLVETFSYIAHATSGDAEVEKWLKSHKDEINNFYSWSDNYSWVK